ncbi:MAG: hypothetical protein KBT75_18165, partial [Oleispira antarctica]|nr:hypothetical protein [Oleispira antarctica]
MKNSNMHILIESTLLHEMVRWRDWEDGKDQTGEKGKNLRRRRMVKALTDIGKAIKVAV